MAAIIEITGCYFNFKNCTGSDNVLIERESSCFVS